MKHSAGTQSMVPVPALKVNDPFMVVSLVCPKSAILMTTGSVRETKMLGGLMSRCTKFIKWM